MKFFKRIIKRLFCKHDPQTLVDYTYNYLTEEISDFKAYLKCSKCGKLYE
jgi:hypothetical protein